MATFYLDYEGGNDANDGTTFANRWKTITSGATAARIAPGDTIRVKQSPDPTSLAVNATWTNGSATVTLASALNALVTNCDTAWTASANVTCTADTTVYRTSTGSAKHAIAAGFATGKVAYLDLGSNQNYSSYEGVTFWFQVTTATLAAGVLTLDFCSDTVGATVVDSFAIPAISQVGQWVPVYVNKGSALGSAIRSISINAISDPGTINLFIDNISTTKAAGNDCLNLTTLIGKNTSTETWWGLRSISGTTLLLDANPAIAVASIASWKGYYGTTETVTGYIRKTITTGLVAASTTAVQAVQDSGTLGTPITFSGGWNTTDMSTQTGETWFDGQSGFGYGYHISSKNYIWTEKMNFVRYYYGIRADGTSTGMKWIGDIHTNNNVVGHYLHGGTGLVDATYRAVEATGILWACGNAEGFNSLNLQNITLNKMWAYGNGYSGLHTAVNLPSIADIKVTEIRTGSSYYGGVSFTGSFINSWVGAAYSKNHGTFGVSFATATDSTIDLVDSDALASTSVAFGNLDSDHRNFFIKQMVCATSSSCQALWLSSTGSCGSRVVIGDFTATGTGIGIRFSGGKTQLDILKSSLTCTTPVFFDSGSYSSSQGGLHIHDYNGTSGDHRNYYGSGSHRTEVFSESSVRHTASGLAWKISPQSTTYWTAQTPFIWPFAKVYLPAGVSKTITVWARRTNTGLTATLRLRAYQLAGITSDQTSSITAAADTWQQLSVTVTPSAAGVVELEMVVYGGSTYSCYIDDLGVS